jgi:hypothetical protein
MKSNIRTFAQSVVAAASKRPMLSTSVLLALGLIAPLHSFAAEPFCIATGGGFGNGGSTYVARNFTPPTANKCTTWSGYTKTASTVILTTTGTACLSSDSKTLTVSVTHADPQYYPITELEADYMQLTQSSSTDPFTGEDYGALGGADASTVTCTSELLTLPASHD